MGNSVEQRLSKQLEDLDLIALILKIECTIHIINLILIIWVFLMICAVLHKSVKQVDAYFENALDRRAEAPL